MPEPNDFEYIDGPEYGPDDGSEAEATRLNEEAEAVVNKPVVCDECGEPLLVGDWPWCASPRNPDGHARGRLTVTVRTGMRKWQKMSNGPVR